MTLIDSHVHLWDTARLDYPWLTGIPAIDSPHLPGEYRDASEGYDVEKLVFVQCDVADGQSRATRCAGFRNLQKPTNRASPASLPGHPSPRARP